MVGPVAAQPVQDDSAGIGMVELLTGIYEELSALNERINRLENRLNQLADNTTDNETQNTNNVTGLNDTLLDEPRNVSAGNGTTPELPGGMSLEQLLNTAR